MAVVRKKQDDKNLKILREIVSTNGNKQCFDCDQRGPTYVNMTIGSFVCTRCSGVLRGLTPPHRVKSISMATFTTEEIEFIKSHGNELCAKTWLGLWDPKRVHTQNQRELMIDKYERKRYYLEPASPLKSLTNATQFGVSQSNGTAQSNGNHSSNGSALWSLSPPNTLNLNANNKTLPAPPSINNFQEHFTPDDNSFFNHSNGGSSTTTAATTNTINGISLSNSLTNNNINNHHQNGISHPANGNGVTSNGVNGNHYLMNGFSRPTASAHNQNVITKNSLNLQQSAAILENSNKFTPDTEFVADFNSANIFNAQTPTANATTMATAAAALNGTTNVTNGTNNNNINNNNSKAFNGNGAMTNGNGTNGFDDGSDANPNFADFEHNTIYNAAAIESINSNYFSYFNVNNNNNNNGQVIGGNSNGSNANNQWSVWQQFQWPYVQPEQNRWSLPMSLSSTGNSLKSSGTFNSNSSINSTPSVDRYAALKDLDEQLREMKDKDNNTQSAPNPANPFNTAQTATVGNPFQATQLQPSAVVPTQNGWHNEQQQFNVCNGNSPNMFGSTHGFGMNGVTTGPYMNGNGLQQSQQQHYQKMPSQNAFNGSTGMSNGYPPKNPFATPVLNATTNPFL